MLLCADDQPPSPVGRDTQPVVEWLNSYGTQPGDECEMLSSPVRLESSDADAEMQDAAEQPAPHTAAHDPLAQLPCSTVSRNTGSQTKSTVTAAPGIEAAVVTNQLATALQPDTDARLHKAGFHSKEQAMAWLTGDGYAKSQTALLPLGVTDSSSVALLQPHQLECLPGLKPVARKKMRIILEALFTDADRLQMVFEQHRSWLEEHLGMEEAGTSSCAYIECTIALAIMH